MIRYFIFTATLLTLSCSSEKNINILQINNDSYKLDKAQDKVFPLDSITSAVSNNYQFHPSDSINYLTFLNDFDNSIYFYDYDSSSYKFKVKYSNEGPNGVGKIMGYSVINKDSILLYNYSKSQLFISDIKGNLNNQIDLSSKIKYQPAPKVSTAQPIILHNKNFWLSGNITGEYSDQSPQNRKVLISYNSELHELAYHLPYPEIYGEGSYGGGTYRWIYHTVNPTKNLLVVSFPASHDLYGFDIKNEDTIKIRNSGSKYIDQIEGFPGNSLFSTDKQALRNHFNKTGSYSSIIYDGYREVYYRYAHHPILDYDEKIREKRVGNGSIIIYDEDLNRIGETLIPKLSHWSKQLIVTKEGLNILQIQEDENSMIFSVFELLQK